MPLYLARHGENEDNAEGILNGHRDRGLTEKGKEQAQKLADKIYAERLNFDEIYSSPLIRARQTAEIIASRLKIQDIKILEDLIERDFGVMTGKPVNKIEELCGDDLLITPQVKYFLNPEGAETFDQLLARGKKVLQSFNSMPQDKNFLLVGHGDMGKMIFAAYHNLDWHEVLPQFHFGNSELIKLSPDTPLEDAHIISMEQ